MDVLLVNAPVKMASKHSSLTPPLGLSYIASVLLKSGYNVSAVDFNISGSDTSSMKRVLERESPSILGISAHTESYLGGLEIADIAKQINPETVVVMGGPHATILYDQAAREKSIDFVVIGEGEYTMLELANALIGKQNSLAEIRGIAYKEGRGIRVTPERPFIEDPDELPFPARALFPLPLYESGGNVLMSRGGCPFKCHFCAVNNIWKGKRRFRRPDKIVEEILAILGNEQAREITFADDIFTLDRRYVVEFCNFLKDTRKTLRPEDTFDWTCSTRVDLVDRELLEVMRQAGCNGIQFGVEAGSQKILDSMGKRIKLEEVRNAVGMTLDLGMQVSCSFMFPHPEDTEETIREQIKLMKELLDAGAVETLTATTPFPGTYYYEHANELGITILANNWDEYNGRHIIISTKHLSKERLEQLLEQLVDELGLELSN